MEFLRIMASKKGLSLYFNIRGDYFSSVWDPNEGNNTTLANEIPGLLNGGLYFNVHTTAFSGGETGGQIEQVIPEPSRYLLLAVGILGVIGMFYRQRMNAVQESFTPCGYLVSIPQNRAGIRSASDDGVRRG